VRRIKTGRTDSFIDFLYFVTADSQSNRNLRSIRARQLNSYRQYLSAIRKLTKKNQEMLKNSPEDAVAKSYNRGLEKMYEGLTETEKQIFRITARRYFECVNRQKCEQHRVECAK